MKRMICLMLSAVLLLSGCVKAPETSGQEPEEKIEYLLQFTPVDRTKEPEDPQQRLQWRRDMAEQEMRRMMSVLWTPAEDITYCYNMKSGGLATDQVSFPSYIVTLKAGRIYQGIPYTHGCGSGDAMISYATEVSDKGVYTLTGLTWEHFSGAAQSTQQKRARLGNNCADSVFWAWATVSNSITFKGTTTMTKSFGCIPVGEYTTVPVQYYGHTRDLCTSNGEQTMYAAYAQMQKADGLVFVNGQDTGHAIMCVSVHVERNEQGQIDGKKSHAVILEQTSSFEKSEKHYFNEELGQEVYLCEELDTVMTFEELYQTGYLPVTCKELVDPAPLEEVAVNDYQKDVTAQNMFEGEIKASHRIAFVRAQVLDADGKQVQDAVCYGKEEEMYRFDLTRFMDKKEQAVMQGSVDLTALPAGSYRVILTAHLSTGDDVEFRNIEVTK